MGEGEGGGAGKVDYGPKKAHQKKRTPTPPKYVRKLEIPDLTDKQMPRRA